MDLADSHHFWDSAAFWPALGIIVGLLTIAATIWVTLRAANSKRRLYYWLLSDTPLITERPDLSEELKVTYGMRELKSPRVVNIQLVSRGRRDIPPEAFNGKPVCLDLGTRIVDCVNVNTWPSDRLNPEYTQKGSTLLIEPSHFGSRQMTVLSLLVEGESPRILPPMQTLVDVRIEHGDGQTLFTTPTRRSVSALAGLMLVGIVTDMLAADAIGSSALLVGTTLLLAGLVFGALVVVAQEAGLWRRRRD